MLGKGEVVGCVHIVQDRHLLPDSPSFASTQSQFRFCRCVDASFVCFIDHLLEPVEMGKERSENESRLGRGLHKQQIMTSKQVRCVVMCAHIREYLSSKGLLLCKSSAIAKFANESFLS